MPPERAESAESNAINNSASESANLSQSTNAEMSGFASLRESMTSQTANLHDVEITGLDNNNAKSNGTARDGKNPPANSDDSKIHSSHDQMKDFSNDPNFMSHPKEGVAPEYDSSTQDPSERVSPADPKDYPYDPSTDAPFDEKGKTPESQLSPAQPGDGAQDKPNGPGSPPSSAQFNERDSRPANLASGSKTMNDIATAANIHNHGDMLTSANPAKGADHGQGGSGGEREEESKPAPGDSGARPGSDNKDPSAKPAETPTEPPASANDNSQKQKEGHSKPEEFKQQSNPGVEASTRFPNPLMMGPQNQMLESSAPVNPAESNEKNGDKAERRSQAAGNDSSSQQDSQPEQSQANEKGDRKAESSEQIDSAREKEDAEHRARENKRGNNNNPKPNFGNSTISGDLDI